MAKQIYDKPVWQLMRDMVSAQGVQPGDHITRSNIEAWFSQRYPKVKRATITAHLLRMSTNAPSRVHYGAKPGDDDLFFQLDSSTFRLYQPDMDPPPIYEPQVVPAEDSAEVDDQAGSAEFAFEKDLRSYLAKNLHLLEPGLHLYEEEGVSGIEFPVGGRSVDILAVDANGDLVVVELKVSRGHDRAMGQLLQYMGWIKENLADPQQKVRGFIVAREITEDLRLTCQYARNVSLFEYELSVTVRSVLHAASTP